MRVSSQQGFSQSVRSILESQSEVLKLQQQLSNGKRIQQPSDDPRAAAQIQDLNHALARNAQFQRNADLLTTRLQTEEATIENATDTLQRARELVLQANNASQSASSREALANELALLSKQLMSVANQQDTSGRHLFSGLQTDRPPFVSTAAGVAFVGDSRQREILYGPGQQMADGDSGADIFTSRSSGELAIALSSGNGGDMSVVASHGSPPFDVSAGDVSLEFAGDRYELRNSAGALLQTGSWQSGEAIQIDDWSLSLRGTPTDGDRIVFSAGEQRLIFDELNSLVAALSGGGEDPASRAQLTQNLEQGLVSIDRVLHQLSDTRSDVGNRLQQLESQQSVNADEALNLQENLSTLEDIDLTETISAFNAQLLYVQAAQSAFAKVQGLSLFQYL